MCTRLLLLNYEHTNLEPYSSTMLSDSVIARSIERLLRCTASIVIDIIDYVVYNIYAARKLAVKIGSWNPPNLITFDFG